jgi:hypothetical protein
MQGVAGPLRGAGETERFDGMRTGKVRRTWAPVVIVALLATGCGETGSGPRGTDNEIGDATEQTADLPVRLEALVQESSVGGCHGQAHELGKEAALTYQPEEALALNNTQLDELCQYGYLHGLLQGYSAAGVDPIKVATEGCGSVQGGAIQECFHAAGHGIALSTGSLQEALESCTEFGVERQEACGGGAFMEYSERYRKGVDPGEGMYVRLLSAEEAESICDWTGEAWITNCALEAAKFWGPTTKEPGRLGERCGEIGKRTGREEVVERCAGGVGRWIQNQARWMADGWERYPETSAGAGAVSTEIATSCQVESGRSGYPGLFLQTCLQYGVHPILFGQVVSGEPESVWVDPCPYLEAREQREPCAEIRRGIVAEAGSIRGS